MTAPVARSGWPRPPVDLRLALGAGAAWLATACCLGRATATVVGVAVAAAAVGTVALALAFRGVRAASAVGLAAFCCSLLLLPYAGRLAQARASPLAQFADRRAMATVELSLTADPRVLAARGIAGSPRVAVDAHASAVVVAGQRFTVDSAVLVLAPASGWRELLPGQPVGVEGRLQPSLDPTSLSVTLATNTAPQLLGEPPWWSRAAGSVRADLRQAAQVLPDPVRGLLPGLIDGDVSGLDPVLADRFRRAGLTHLVAVSGTNVSILLAAVLLAFRRVRSPTAVSAIVGAVVVVAFVVIARPSPSVVRSALMAIIMLVALAGGRMRQAVPALGVAVLGMLLWNPLLARDAGFTMSVLATAAILLIAPRWAAALRRRHVPVGLAEALAVATAAHVVTAPVIAAIAGHLSVVAIPANVLAEPVVAVTTVLGFLAAVVAPLWLGLATPLVWLAGWPTRWLVAVADWFGGLSGATVGWPGGVAGGLALMLVTALVGLLAAHRGPRLVLAAAAAAALLVQLPIRSLTSGWPPQGWRVVACDVGQGDALVLRAGPHSAVAVDVGGDPLASDRCLHALGVSDVALLVLTHYHVDHVGGIVGALHDRHVGAVVTGPLDEPRSGSELVAAALARGGLTLGAVHPGDTLDIGDVQLEVLAPPAAYHHTHSDPNNSSLVLRAAIGGLRVLLTGDIEVEAQRAMIEAGLDIAADVLKVPHHGSAYSDPAFLERVAARAALISVGAHNDYGHPSPVLLRVLDRLGVPTWRTDHHGDVAVVGSGDSMYVVSRRADVAPAGSSGTPMAPSATSATSATSVAGAGGSSAVLFNAGPTLSLGSARMGACPHAPSAWTTCRTRFPGWCCWSGTRSCWSPARSPPSWAERGVPTPT